MVNARNLMKFSEAVKAHLCFNEDNLKQIKKLFLSVMEKNEQKYSEFEAVLPSLKEALCADLKFFMESDPAADSEEEILLAYPGYKAIASYRIAHAIHGLGYKLQARMITEGAHSQTGIDIHPASKLAAPLFIDHGTGIVVGETTITGKNVKIYQGVTLGALSLKDGSKIKHRDEVEEIEEEHRGDPVLPKDVGLDDRPEQSHYKVHYIPLRREYGTGNSEHGTEGHHYLQGGI